MNASVFVPRSTRRARPEALTKLPAPDVGDYGPCQQLRPVLPRTFIRTFGIQNGLLVRTKLGKENLITGQKVEMEVFLISNGAFSEKLFAHNFRPKLRILPDSTIEMPFPCRSVCCYGTSSVSTKRTTPESDASATICGASFTGEPRARNVQTDHQLSRAESQRGAQVWQSQLSVMKGHVRKRALSPRPAYPRGQHGKGTCGFLW